MDIGDSLTGKTEVFGASVLCSNQSPRATGEGVRGNFSRVAGPPRQMHSATPPEASGEIGAVRAVGRQNVTPPQYSSNPLPSPCRLCGGPTWLQDEEGSIHPCCELSRVAGAKVDADGLLVCLSCRASEVLNREQRNRKTPVRVTPGPEQVNPLPYEVGACSACHRTSIRLFAQGKCFYCTAREATWT